MVLQFAKLNGLGNDFVMVDDREEKISLTEEDARKLCDRHFGIGADGVILVRPPKHEGCAAYMHYINSDGTLAQMCGNGVRCFAKFLVDRGIVDPESGSFVADTLAGPRPITFNVDDAGKLVDATVDMGSPILDPAAVPVACPANAETADGVPFAREAELSSPWGPFAFTFVSMGNPHAVTFVDDWGKIADELFSDPADKSLETLDLNKIGAYFESHEAFPEKANIEFAVIEDDGISMRVFERGCGETLACGTGACATSVAATLTGRCGRENDVKLRGGVLHIKWNEDNRVMMTGAAAQSFEGSVDVALL